MRLRSRIERSAARRGLGYPWWIPVYCSLGSITVTVLAVVQRSGAGLPAAVVCGGLLALVPQVYWMVTARLLPTYLDALLVTTAVLVLMFARPVDPDFAPLLLVISAAQTGATAPLRTAVVVAVADLAALGVAAGFDRLTGVAVYLVGVLFGADGGIALQWQMRALAAERARRQIAGEQAVLAERQRIAREVHDVVGHSLSIALLHIIGARQALHDGDVVDAADALEQGEKVGRAAMVDLRRSVGLIAAGPSGTEPLPDLSDIPALGESAAAAGLRVRCEVSGALDSAPSVGLTLFRIAQESLSNIAKHAPESHAVVRLVGDPSQIRLTIRNGLPAAARTGTDGSGVASMRARADQLGAALQVGPRGDEWVVDVVLPVSAVPATPEQARSTARG
jgi:signal transduction histidine kinase